MEFGILGPLEVRQDGRERLITGAKQRALLAVLLLNVNQVVSCDRLVEELWGSDPPESGHAALRVRVSQLRKVLEPECPGNGSRVLRTRPPGYVLVAEPGTVDLLHFRQLADEGSRALADGNMSAASAKLENALSLWRGAALADFLYEPFAQPAARWLEELRLATLEKRIEADLALGQHDDVAGELETLVAENPLRESLTGHRMLALYRAGRQAEALGAYQVLRRRLVEDLGIEPGEPLQSLQRAILRHDPALDLPETPRASDGHSRHPDAESPGSRVAVAAPSAGAREVVPGGWRRRRRPVVIAGAVGVVASAMLVLLGTNREDRAHAGISANSVGVIDPRSNRLVASVQVGASPLELASGAGSVWVTDFEAHAVSRINPRTRTVVETIPLAAAPDGIVFGNRAVWIAGVNGMIWRIDPQTDTVVETIPAGTGPAGLAFGDGSVWVANTFDGTVTQFDSSTGAWVRTIPIGAQTSQITWGQGAVWVTDPADGRVSRIDPATGAVTLQITVGNGPTGLAFGDGSAWAVNSLDGTVARINPATGMVTGVIRVGNGATGIAAGAGAVWVTNEFAGTISRIDPVTNEVVKTISAGNRPAGIAAAGGLLWFSVRPPGADHRGGTLVLLTRGAGPIDPATAYEAVAVLTLFMTNDGLTAFQRVGGIPGTKLVPDLAVSIPEPTQGGITYTFLLRRGIRYSTGKLVQPQDFRYAIERDFRLQSPGMGFYEGIVGAAACASNPAKCDLSRGIVTNDHAGTVTFHLVAPDPQFLDKLALWGADAVPVGTPAGGASTAVPATGPYMIQSYAPGRELRLVRNPHFRVWSQAAQPNGYPDQIVWKIGGRASAAVTAIERGNADWSIDFPPPTRIHELQMLYASQLHIYYPGLTTDYLFLNTRIPPFDNPSARRALNLAIDRARIVNQLGGSAYASPTCQLLPPGIPGFRRYCPYTANPSRNGAWTAPDRAKAQRLVAASGTKGMAVTVWAGPGEVLPLASERYVVSVLDRLGYEAHLKSFGTMGGYVSMVADSRNRAQIGFAFSTADYPAASDLINPLLTCAAFTPRSPSNTNWAEFCDKRIEAQIRRAMQATGSRANQLWMQIDHELVNSAPLVPFVNRTWIDFVSKRVGNYQFSWQAGPLLDQFWIRP
jgi:YVTN family beta-propeller protein